MASRVLLGRLELRDDTQDEARIRGQDALRPVSHLVRRGAAVTIQVGLERVGLIEEELVAVQRIRFPEQRLQLSDGRELQLRLLPIQFVLGRDVLHELVDDRIDGGLERVERYAWLRGHLDVEEGAEQHGALVRVDLHRHIVVVDELPVASAGDAV